MRKEDYRKGMPKEAKAPFVVGTRGEHGLAPKIKNAGQKALEDHGGSDAHMPPGTHPYNEDTLGGRAGKPGGRRKNPGT